MRIPGWTAGDAEVKINDQALEAVADPGSYLAIHRVWQDGDTVSISLPMELRQEALPGDESVAAVLYGPLVLAADLGPGPADGPSKIILGGNPWPSKNLPAASSLPKVAAAPEASTKQWMQVDSATELRFTAAGNDAKIPVSPMCRIRDQRYSVYWQTQSQKEHS